jgi:DNA-binding winged helix-turn-helix (wHTH) protein
MNDGNARQNRTTPRVIAFGDFELRLDTRELTRRDMRVRLPPQPFHILRTLLEEPGAVITRDELRRILWPPNTHVDFEAGLNTAMNRLRAVLGDSADHPIYIETVSRIGYRFIAPVRSLAPVVSIPSDRDNDLTGKELTIVRPSPAPHVVKPSSAGRLQSAFLRVLAFCLRPFSTRAHKEPRNERPSD